MRFGGHLLTERTETDHAYQNECVMDELFSTGARHHERTVRTVDVDSSYYISKEKGKHAQDTN